MCRSKSLGNFFTIRDVLKKYHGMAMRWFLVSTQYRQPMNYSQVALEEASARLYYVTETLVEARKMITASGARPLHPLHSAACISGTFTFSLSSGCACYAIHS